MDGLLDNARRLLAAMRDALASGPAEEDWTVLVGPDGGLQMIAAYCSPLESLAWSHGARTAWRATREGGTIRVEGQAGADRCRLEAQAGEPAGLRLLSIARLYVLA